MSVIGEAVVKVVADTDAFERGLTDRLGGTFRKVAGIASAIFAGVQVGQFFTSAIHEAEDAQRVIRDTASVIKSTGGAAKVSAGDVDNLANSLSRMSGVDDEAIAGAQNLILTFTKVRNETGKGNDIFKQATKAALDLSARFGQDLSSSAIQVGKALNDPIAGVTALRRVGVQLTQSQEDQIKAFVKSGDVLSAQKVILAELAVETGGAAEANATASDKIRVAFGNIKEDLGTSFLPIVERVAEFMSDRLPGIIDNVKVKVGEFVAGFQGTGDESSVFSRLGDTARSFYEFFRDTALPILRDVATFLTDTALPAVASFINFFNGKEEIILGVVAAVLAFKTTSTIIGVIDGVRLAITGMNLAMAATPAASAGANAGLLGLAGTGIVAAIAAGIGLGVVFNRFIEKHFPEINDGFEQVGASIVDWSFNVAHAAQEVGAVWGRVFRAIGGFLTDFVLGVRNAWDFVVRFARSIGPAIGEALGNLGSTLYNAGRSLVQGLINGIRSMGRAIIDAVLRLIPGPIRNAVSSALGIRSPSTVFFGYGQNIVQGLIDGVRASRTGLMAEMNRLSLSMAVSGGGSMSVGATGAAGSSGDITTPAGAGVAFRDLIVNEAVDADATAEAVLSRFGTEIRT